MKARSVVDVILGEAVSGTPQQRYQDMLAIASVIKNRADMLGTTPENVIGVKSEFNAYGKSLPQGVQQYRDLAAQAWNQVTTTGPVHNATFYATPAASTNLPNGLQPVTQTAGHVYYADPMGRAIKTVDGFVRPQAQALNPVTDSNTQFVGGIDVVDLTNDIPYARTATQNMQPFEGAVIHHSEPATLTDVRNITNNPRPGGAYLGYHYALDPAGNIGQLAPLDVRTNHIGIVPSSIDSLTNANSLGISFLDAYNGFTPQQVQAAGETIAAVNRAGNLGFIDPDTGIAYHGKGATLTRPVEGLAEAQAVKEYLGGLPFGPYNTPVPTPKPEPQVQQTDGIMAAIDPPTPQPVERGLLSTPVSGYAGAGVEAGLLGSTGEVAPQSFDMARFGDPAPQGFDPSRMAYGTPAASFDVGRFGPMTGMNYDAMAAAVSPQTPAAAATASNSGGILGSLSPISSAQAAQPTGLLGSSIPAGMAEQYAQYGMGQQALISNPGYQQQLAAANLAQDVAAINPNIQQPVQPAQTTPGYVDPMVTTQAAPVQAIEAASPAPARSIVQSQSAPVATATPEGLALGRQVDNALRTRGILGSVGGALLGGALLGPVGGLLGGFVGRNAMQRSYYPEAPAGGKRSDDRSYGGLNERGRDTYKDSGQFRDAVDKGSAGLW